ncbi:hypothetical protein DEO72_LG11g1781 [Vigna unguiculata]|uniref:Uncharacterized protein n=1 Tax=Vigna unguiculata TaxID=3917 RepID=A0A4D6NR72_VIGUN|nr:hypothetical protein DEO72_LG11g1781 [Vigna unguiculata]
MSKAVSLSQTPKTPDRALLGHRDCFIFELDTVWGRTGILAQASSSRLGENIRGSPKVLPRALAHRATIAVSPKREPVA